MPSSGVMVPCLTCGSLSDSSKVRRGRCTGCYSEYVRNREASRVRAREDRLDRRGAANTAWKKLSAKARELQPWCSNCKRTKEQLDALGLRLEGEHTPEAWAATIAKKPVTLSMIDVLCGPCNRDAGPATPGSKRYAEWEASRNA